MSQPNAALCLFALVFIFTPSVSVCGVKQPLFFFQISISVSFSGYDTILYIILVGIFRSWNCFWRYLENEHTKRKNKKMLNRIFESSLQDVNTVVCRATSAQPLSLHALHLSSHPTPSPSSRFLWILPAALSSLHLPDSQHTLCLRLAPT